MRPKSETAQSNGDRSQQATLHQNSNGGPQEQNGSAQNFSTMVDIVSKLSSTVQSLQQNVINLTARVNSISSTQCNGPTQENNATTVGPSTFTAPVHQSSEEYNLDTAFARLSSSAAGSATQATDFKRTRFGFSAESLPLVETISPALRQQIITGKDVNLASLLIPYYNPADDKVDGRKQDKRLDIVLNLGEFIQAFGIFKNIMCSAYPQRRPELDLYERDIIDMATRYPGNRFYDYHRQFSLLAASHLNFNNVLVDWSVRNNTLFCNLFANAKAQSCSSCGSTLHQTGFCHLTGSGSDKRSDTDHYGRRKMYHEGREICNNFNGSKGCFAQKCRHVHVCLECKGAHPLSMCEQAKNSKLPHFSGASIPPRS